MEKYFFEQLWSDRHAYEVIRKVSDITYEIRRMDAVLDPQWKPEWVCGGFAGRCVNQHTQKWIFSQNESNPIIRIRKKKKGAAWCRGQDIFYPSNNPLEFRDFNF